MNLKNLHAAPVLAASLVCLGRYEEAHQEIAGYSSLMQNTTDARRLLPVPYSKMADLQRLRDDIRKARVGVVY